MAGNGSTADEELEEALRLSMIVDDNTTNGTGSQSNSTTEVGGTQSRSTVSPGEFAQMFALCLATAVYQQSLSPPVSQGPAPMDQPGTEFPLNDGRSGRWWLFLSYTYFSPRPSSGGNLFDLRPRRIAFASPSSARPPPCSCGGATWAGYLDNPTFVAAITGHLSSGACGEVKCPVM